MAEHIPGSELWPRNRGLRTIRVIASAAMLVTVIAGLFSLAGSLTDRWHFRAVTTTTMAPWLNKGDAVFVAMDHALELRPGDVIWTETRPALGLEEGPVRVIDVRRDVAFTYLKVKGDAETVVPTRYIQVEDDRVFTVRAAFTGLGPLVSALEGNGARIAVVGVFTVFLVVWLVSVVWEKDAQEEYEEAVFGPAEEDGEEPVLSDEPSTGGRVWLPPPPGVQVDPVPVGGFPPPDPGRAADLPPPVTAGSHQPG